MNKITIEEIKKLNAARGDHQFNYDSTNDITNFYAAAPSIAQLAIELAEENEKLKLMIKIIDKNAVASAQAVLNRYDKYFAETLTITKE